MSRSVSNMARFDRRLNSVLSETSRRDFLKTAGTAAASVAAGGLPTAGATILKTAGTAAKLSPVASMWQLLEAGFTWDPGLLTKPEYRNRLASPAAVAKAVADSLNGRIPQEADAGNLVACLDSSGLLDEYTGGQFTNAMNAMMKSHGPHHVAKLLTKHVIGDMRMGSSEVLHYLSDMSRRFPLFARAFPLNELQKASNVEDGAKLLRKHRLIDDDKLQSETERQREWDERTAHKPEMIIPRPDDHLYGSSMHQPFDETKRWSIAMIAESLFE